MDAAHFGLTQAVDEIRRRLTFGIHPSLDGVAAVCEALGRPQDAYRCVQIAGTNGKSSTTRLVAAVLGGHGFRVGTYTSPDLTSITDRFEVDAAAIGPQEFADAVRAVLDAESRARAAGTLSAGLTEFELLTATAFVAFRSASADIAVLEVGMGGRWDATSVSSPRVVAITGVALDHTEHLGTTLEAIAAEKGAIIHPGSVAVLGPGTVDPGVESVLMHRANEVGATVIAVRERGDASPVSEQNTVRFERTRIPRGVDGMLGVTVRGRYGDYGELMLRTPRYQAANVATAIAAAEACLGEAPAVERLARSLESVRFPGRFELVAHRPPVLIDAAHNPEAAGVLAGAISDAFPDLLPVMVLGVLADKDARGIVTALAPVVRRFIVTASDSPRALSPEALAQVVAEVTGEVPEVVAGVTEALTVARAGASAGVVVTGSITVAGEALRNLVDSA